MNPQPKTVFDMRPTTNNQEMEDLCEMFSHMKISNEEKDNDDEEVEEVEVKEESSVLDKVLHGIVLFDLIKPFF